MDIDFLNGVGKGRSIAVDCRETINWYPELSETDGAKSKIALYPTPGLKLFGNPYVESYSAPATNTIVAAFTTRYNNETAAVTQFVTLTFTATKQKIVKNYSWSFGDGIAADGTKTLLTTDSNVVTHKYDLTNGLINSGALPAAIQPAGYTGGTGTWATVVLTVTGYDGQTATYTGYVYKITSNGTVLADFLYVYGWTPTTWTHELPDGSAGVFAPTDEDVIFLYDSDYQLRCHDITTGATSWLWKLWQADSSPPYYLHDSSTSQHPTFDLTGWSPHQMMLELTINGNSITKTESELFNVTGTPP
jgi:hypothetical protein